MRCKCGHVMGIRLRTVIYSTKVEIENVPVYTCEYCNRSEVFAGVKHELTSFIQTLGREPEKKKVYFNELNELANLMHKVADKEHMNVSVEEIIGERINQLLDILILAQSLGDEPWVEDTRVRLAQITRHAFSAHELNQ